MSEPYTITVPALSPDGSTLPAVIDTMTLSIGLISLILLTWLGLAFFAGKRRASCSAGRWRLSCTPFKQRPLLNKGEARLLTVLDRVVLEILGPTARVWPQVSYVEFLSCSKFSKFARLNADFVVTTDDHSVAFVVELQGSGHFVSTVKSAWKARNAARTKRSALNEASIPLLELTSTPSEASMANQIQALITPQQKGYNHV